MAITWGSWAGSSTSRRFRVGIDFVRVSSTATSAVWRRDIYYETGANLVDNYAKFSGTGTGSWSFSIGESTHGDYSNNGNQTKLLRSDSQSFSYAYGNSTSATATVSLSGIDYVSGYTATAKATITFPALAHSAPPGPGSAKAVVGTAPGGGLKQQVSLSWTSATGTSDAPITNTLVERAAGSSAWKLIVTLSGSLSNYIDTSVVPNERYRYRVKHTNSGGSSGYSTSEYVYTSPAVPTSLSATRDGNDIYLRWTNNAPWKTGDKIRCSTNNGTSWTEESGISLTDDYIKFNPDSTKVWIFQVASLVPGDQSGWSASSAPVQLLAPPNPPSNLISGVATAGEITKLTWQHNPTDTTAQSAYTVRWRVQGESAWTTRASVASSVSYSNIPAGTFTNGTTVEWQVRTKGQHATYSEYSSSQFFKVTERPVVGITGPATAPASGKINATWSFSDAEGSAQASWRMRLLVDGTVVESRSGSASTTRVTEFTTVVPDGSSIQVEGEASDSDGMWSLTSKSSIFTVAYSLPVKPRVEVVFDSYTGSATIQINNDEGVNRPAVAYNRVLAEDEAGGWRVVADNVPVNGSVVDSTPRLGTRTVYKVEAVSVLPSVNSTETTSVFHDCKWFYFTDRQGVSVRIGGNPEHSITTEKEIEYVAFEGRKWPVAYSGKALSQPISLSADLWGDSHMDTYNSLERLMHINEPVCYRSPKGQRSWVMLNSVALSESGKQPAGGKVRVELSMSRIATLDEVV